jgi:ATP-dependent 26S proteasome regulatory subunit
MGELSLRETKIDSIFTELSENYNDDLLEINDIILKRLNKENDKGLVLLHGIPGTGKTSYIRHLIQNIEKNLIYMPTDLAREIANPSFIDFMLENKNSVLIIEDAEDILESRNSGRNGVLANLLNVTDGLLSDCLKIQIVCTFNTNLKNIDSALLRKGRLIARYEFKKLSVQKSQALSAKLGFDKTINNEMTLSEIFNQEEMLFEEIKKTIGF